ncbi:hypothetical protein F0562_023013 [Nyssa sinensis]|uniref:RING-type E3 ubiquitin transferase n=1 Tax=Nyssa sinensis TaxID=561372 RepID=A0A5J5BL34_9ASTE|nr:hypothetical protein F0562_023013 [Nyssa sinensis]
MASTLLKKNTNFRLGILVKKLFLKYPAVGDPSNRTSLSLLSEELCFDVNALPVPDPLLYTQPPQTFVKFQVFSLGPLFGRCWPHLSHSCEVEVTDCHVNPDSSKHRLPLNISAHLTLDGNSYSHLSELFLEGLYDPLGGRMYLIGCRNVPESQKSIYSKMKLESKMDCLIQVKIEYSSRTVRWLVNPTAKVSIASQRNEDDPLYFGPINLRTFSIPHKDNSREIIFRQNFEAIYRILMLLASIACVQSQLFYIRKKADVIPFISLVMLGVQALGFSLPIITDATILFRWKEYEHPETRSLRVGCADKPLTLTHNPGDKRVFLSTLIIHMVGFLVVLIIHNMKVGDSVHVRTNQKLPEWVTELDKYMGLIQDFLLLPQVIGNVIWQIQVKPLSKVYYIGFTALRLLLHGYNYLRDPVFSPHFHKYDSNTSSAFFTKFEGGVDNDDFGCFGNHGPCPAEVDVKLWQARLNVEA